MDKNPLDRWLGPPVRFAALAAGYAVLLITIAIGLEIILRRGFGISLQGADEFGGYMLATVTAIGAGYALLERGHTRIEILVERVPHKARAALNFVSVLFMSAMSVFLAWRAVVAVRESMEYQSLSGTPLMTPLWMPQAVWAGGMVLFAVVATCIALHCLRLLIGDWRGINQWYGIKTLSEEIEEVTSEVEAKTSTKDSAAPAATADGEQRA